MTTNFKTLNFTYIARTAPKNGPTSSDAWNDSFSELAIDLAAISSEWNNKLVVLLETLPKGDLTDEIDAFTSGLDGTTLWVDSNLTSTSDDLKFFNSVKNRPITIEESLREIYIYVDNQLDELTETIIDEATGLTTDQKNRIGANVFDNTATSSASSLDGKSENNRLNIIQLAKEIYGTGYTLDNDGASNLTNSIKDMVDALLELHNGNWSDDITIDHSSIPIPTQSQILSSIGSENDAYLSVPTYLVDDLNQIKTYIKILKGTTAWKTTLPALYTAGADSIYDLLSTTYGTGTKTSTNPWGYNYSDIDGLNTRLEAIRTFTGQTTQTDSAPTYISTYSVRNSDGLELSIGNLDRDLYAVSGVNTSQNSQLTALESFAGQSNDTDSIPTFTSNYSVTPGMNLEQAIGRLDNNLYTTSGIVNSGINHIYAVGTFVGQGSPTDSSPNYLSNNYVVDGTSLETAISTLDNALASAGSTITTHGLQLDALETFVGQNSNTDITPGYSSNYSVINGMSLETAIGRLDNNLYTTSGVVNSGINHIYAIGTFTGQGSPTDNSPNYSSNNYVTNGDSLETAIGKLDTKLETVSGITVHQTSRLDSISTFIGQSSLFDSTPDYLTTYNIDQNSDLETAISSLDYELNTISGVVNSGINHIYAIGPFIGQSSPTDNSPSYISTNYISDGNSLELAIGKLDSQLSTTSGTVVTNTNQLDALEAFVGQNSNTDNSPTYISNTYITNGNSLELAIGKLDSHLTTLSGSINSDYINKDGSIAMTGTFNVGNQDIYRAKEISTTNNLTCSGNITTSGTFRAETNAYVGRDIEITASSYGVVMSSPNGQKWRITIGDFGELTTTLV